jgi:hypothetical protein
MKVSGNLMKKHYCCLFRLLSTVLTRNRRFMFFFNLLLTNLFIRNGTHFWQSKLLLWHQHRVI